MNEDEYFKELTDSSVHCNEKRTATDIPPFDPTITQEYPLEDKNSLRKQHSYTTQKSCPLGAGSFEVDTFVVHAFDLGFNEQNLGDRSAHRQLTDLGCI